MGAGAGGTCIEKANFLALVIAVSSKVFCLVIPLRELQTDLLG